MRIINHEQGSDEWLQSRLGKPTASNFGKLITPTGKGSTSAEAYINELIAQRITGELPEFYTNEAMARGNELEPAAKACTSLLLALRWLRSVYAYMIA
jgi:hypothetical protein